MKRIKYLCPNCLKISERLKVLYLLMCEDTIQNGRVKETENLENEIRELKFDCGCITDAYGIEDIEVIIDEITKTIDIFNEFKKYEQEIKKQNPEYKDFKIIWD